VTRVYLAVGEDELRRLVTEHTMPGPLAAHAVTSTLRAAWPDGDEEQWEYAALLAAAADAHRRCTDGSRRRFVLAADAAGSPVPDAGADVTSVSVPDGLRWGQIAALHADAADLSERLLADAEAAADEDLAWFATQEIESLL
jgi:hypothetical protein